MKSEGYAQDEQGAPVPSLDLRCIGDIYGRFFVAKYQRGYRWTEHEVTRLLDDIRGNGSNPYLLQPIVVKGKKDGRWELIDGQQRLTTIFLILRYMERERLKIDGARYTIEYETREESEAFLRDPDPARRNDNIDFHHIHGAYDCIKAWFESAGRNRQLVADDLYGAILRHVQVVWYVAPGDVDSTALFTRLNVGRIPLTDAELLKAHLLTRLGSGQGPGARALELAMAWDRVEKDLWDPGLWAFVCGDLPDARPTRLTLLLDALAGRCTAPERPPYFTFGKLQDRAGRSAEGAQRLWNEVLDLHGLLIGWYADRGIYHKVGYLVAIGVPFADLVELASGCRKSEFQRRLVSRIREELALSPGAIRDLRYDSEADRRAMHRLLLLMNVETVGRRESPLERYPFAQHTAATWSLEHIHAQHSEGLVRAEQWEAWRVDNLAALQGLPSHVRPAERQRMVARLQEAEGALDRKSFAALDAEVGAFLTAPGMDAVAPEFGMHGIANMALLEKNDNAALNNGAFEVKRRRILKMDRDGSFLPVCTRQVFLKYYSEKEGQQLHLWGPEDRKAYLEAMLTIVSPYIGEEGAQA